MTIDPDKVRNWPFREVEQTYTAKDTILYALGLGLGADPLDERELDFTFEEADDFKALPTLAVVLAGPGFWVRDAATGIDWVKVLHGEQGLRIHKPLPPAATVTATAKVTGLVDKGADKGALIYSERTLLDTAMGFRWSFGGREQADDRNFDGTLRGIRIWDRELSGAEVLTLFQGGKRFIDYSETYPKSYQLTLEGLTTNEEIIFRDFLRVARPATYNGTVLVVPDPAFGYDDSTATVVTDVEGFADATKTIDVGGPYAHVIIL